MICAVIQVSDIEEKFCYKLYYNIKASWSLPEPTVCVEGYVGSEDYVKL